MEFIIKQKPITLTLTKNLERSIKSGHPWVYAEALQGGAKGSTYGILQNRKGKTIARGIYDPESKLAFRVCRVGAEPLDTPWVLKNLETAFAKRTSILHEETNACRLLFGEGDGLPGLVCDLYNDILVFQTDGAAPGTFWNINHIAQWFAKHLHVKSAYLKFRPDHEKKGEILLGEKALRKVLFKENGVEFKADIINGQKTGFFLDQRENRRRIQNISRNKTVLNLFGYTGGFSVYAGKGGALEVTTVDISKPATIESHQNWLLNNLPEDRHFPVAANVFDFLDQSKATKGEWDIVIVDPPSFASSQKNREKARQTYTKLFTLSAKVVTKGGTLALSSCSSHIDNTLFYIICQEAISKANRKGTVLGFFNQPGDHPYPLACQELRYLKFLLIALD